VVLRRAVHAPDPAWLLRRLHPVTGDLLLVANWFWGVTPSALDGLLRISGFEPIGRWRASPFHVTVAAIPH
jgi:hypothetical protein